MFLHQNESLATFTITHPFSPDAVTMFPYYCVEDSAVRDTVVMIHGYVVRERAVVRTEMMGVFRHTDNQAEYFLYTRQ